MSSIDITFKKSIFNDIYYEYLRNYSYKYEVYYGGAGSGKSVFVVQKNIIKLLSEKRRLLVVRKIKATLRDSVHQQFKDVLEEWGLLPFVNINKSDFTIEMPNGSEIIFKGLDDSEKIKSITDIDDIWIEEASEITLNDFTQLDLRARKADSQILLSFNPVSKANWTYLKWFNGQKVETNTLILKTTYKDNKFLPKKYIETLEALIKTNPTYYKIYALGEFCTLSKRIYDNWEVADLNVVELKQNKNLLLLVGLDFGFTNDLTALEMSFLDEENKTIYIFDEFGDTGLTNDKIANIITAKGLAKSDIIADSAEEKSIQEIKRFGISRIRGAKKGGGSVLQGIQELQQFKIIVNSTCTGTITELENYSWKKDRITGEYTNEPDKNAHFDHFLDALRYSMQCRRNNKIRTMKSIL